MSQGIVSKSMTRLIFSIIRNKSKIIIIELEPITMQNTLSKTLFSVLYNIDVFEYYFENHHFGVI